MTDRLDIVARLREYTRHNKPVLASDLKEAADHIEELRRKVDYLLAVERGAGDSAQAQVISLARRVSEQAGHAFDPHEDIARVWLAVGEVRRERDALHGLLCDIVDATSFRGVPLAGPDLVEHVRRVVRDRDALLPQDLPDEGRPPVMTEPGRLRDMPHRVAFDEVDRRMAALESRVRRTEQRLQLVVKIIDDGRHVPTSPSVILSRIGDALEAKS